MIRKCVILAKMFTSSAPPPLSASARSLSVSARSCPLCPLCPPLSAYVRLCPLYAFSRHDRAKFEARKYKKKHSSLEKIDCHEAHIALRWLFHLHYLLLYIIIRRSPQDSLHDVQAYLAHHRMLLRLRSGVCAPSQLSG
jgi:hypothetical protein